ncbi:cytochrome P450 [Lentzea sp. DG1S-22]|uniref:cytochrome P450 n=1 Tax=Lentzea sp. DG1S-22 TaxID=3108822 RepID=UPI002E798766|nr:cytochrome P450 [Lentzea sp. DG1S-22]WVH82425.1 cytochrome P450 [Lentzea sp. DG1S-22]
MPTHPFPRVALPSGHEAVLITRHADVAAALTESRLTRELTAPGSPRLSPGESFRDIEGLILNMDGEGHRRIRRVVASAFTPARVRHWQPLVRRVASTLVAEMTAGGSQNADLVASFTNPLPVLVIGGMLGIPEQDTARFHEWSDAFALADGLSPAEREAQMAEFGDYLVDLVARRRAHPSDGLVDELIAARDGSDRLSEPELVSLLIALIVGGTHTSTNALGRAMLNLLRDDGALWRQLVADPSLIPAATEELLRHSGLGDLRHLRVATADIDLPSGPVSAGEVVVIASMPALRDGSVFDDPDVIKLDRGCPAHLSFGGGQHYCLGAHLARSEFHIALAELVERMPALRLAVDEKTLLFSEGSEFSVLKALPVSWSAA